MSAHTPGPWTFAKSTARGLHPESKRVDILSTGTEFNPSFVAAQVLPEDARLIAAAPELAAALGRLVVDVETIVANHEVHPPGAALDALAMGPDSPLRTARLALVKAGGAPADAPDPVAVLRRVLRWYGEKTDGEMQADLYDDVCRAVGEGVYP